MGMEGRGGRKQESPATASTGSPRCWQGSATPGTVPFARAHEPGSIAGAGEQGRGAGAAGSHWEVSSGVGAGGWSHVSPAAAVQADCRPMPEPSAAALRVKNSLLSLPAPSSAALFLTQNADGAWFTAEHPPHCTHQDESAENKQQLHHRVPLLHGGRGPGQDLAAREAQHRRAQRGIFLGNVNSC